jgi:hypothetical protein
MFMTSVPILSAQQFSEGSTGVAQSAQSVELIDSQAKGKHERNFITFQSRIGLHLPGLTPTFQGVLLPKACKIMLQGQA